MHDQCSVPFPTMRTSCTFRLVGFPLELPPNRDWLAFNPWTLPPNKFPLDTFRFYPMSTLVHCGPTRRSKRAWCGTGQARAPVAKTRVEDSDLQRWRNLGKIFIDLPNGSISPHHIATLDIGCRRPIKKWSGERGKWWDEQLIRGCVTFVDWGSLEV